jgi:hypothetical protein
MKKSVKKKSNLYAFLDSTKVLETGSEQAIVEARKAYWKAYKAEWRQKQRKSKKLVVIVLSREEAMHLKENAQTYKRSLPGFIKASCFAYLGKQYLAPDPTALSTIRQLLAMNYNALQKLFDENIIPFEAGRMVLSQIAGLEQKVISELYHPKEQHT